MLPTLRAETRKLLTVRSTYFILGSVLIIVLFVGFFVNGYRLDRAALLDPTTLAGDITGAVSVISLFSGIIAILLMTHEYRYNTIMYTLTASKSRSRVLLAKILVITCFSIIFTAIFSALTPVLCNFGASVHHLTLVQQTIPYKSVIWKCLFYGWGYSIAAFIIAALIRNQIGSIIVVLIAPATVEGLLGLVLKNNVVYLPFSALATVIGSGMNYHNAITPFHAALVFLAYVAVGLIVSFVLFQRRDAGN
jgi:ABC-2 type transport system permease protein